MSESSPPVSVEDVAQLLELVASAAGHPQLTYNVLPDTQKQIKAFIADKKSLQDTSILAPLDRILKCTTAAQLPHQLPTPVLAPSDYVDAKPEETAEPEPVQEQQEHSY